MIDDDDRTRQSTLPTPTPDDQATAPHSDVGVVAELRAVFGNGDKKTLPLYTLPDQIVVGRGTASDWQLDDPSLSRKHCQLKWNGSALTVEDLGSANGTRVGARSARQPLPVGPDDVVQLGTVMISLVSLVRASGRNVDAETTRLVPAPAGGTGETTPLAPLPAAATVVKPPPDLAPLPAAATVVRAPTQHGPPNARAAVFHPDRDAAGPDEPTRRWDAQAALVHPPERNLDAAELMVRLGTAWRTNRRPFVLAGAALWIALLLGLMAWKQPRAVDDDIAPPPHPAVATTRAAGDRAATSAALKPGSDATGPQLTRPAADAVSPAAVAGDNVVEPSVNRSRDLADAVAAYDNGRPQEALKYFRRLATDPNDKSARFMVELIETRGGAP